jgi:hypothetical protein
MVESIPSKRERDKEKKKTRIFTTTPVPQRTSRKTVRVFLVKTTESSKKSGAHNHDVILGGVHRE